MDVEVSSTNIYFLILVSNKVIDFCQKQGTRTQSAHFKLQNPIWLFTKHTGKFSRYINQIILL